MTPSAAVALAMLASQVATGGSGHHEAELMYATQLSFSADGVPVVTVGIMDGQERVTLTSATGLTLQLSGPARAELRIPAGHSLTAHVEQGKAGQTRFRVVLEGLRGGDLAGLQQARRRWSDRGLELEELELGGVVGFPGKVLDNRSLRVLEKGAHPTREAAEERASELADKWQLATPPAVFAQPVTRASGTIVASDPIAGVTVRQQDILSIRATGGGPVEVKRVEYGRGYSHHGFADRRYHGEIVVAVDSTAHVAVVNRLSAEVLLRGLVPAEIFPTAPASTLEAQAITARGELMAKLGVRHLADPYLVCATQHCQVYSGTEREKASTDAAVERTRGKMLFDGDGHLVDSVYSASCGGHTEHNEHVWEGPGKDSLRGRHDGPGRAGWKDGAVPTEAELREFLVNPPDAWCRRTTKGKNLFRWTRSFPQDELDRLVNARHAVGRVTGVEVLERGVSGRVVRVKFVGRGGAAVVKGELAVRRLLGNLRSGMFVVDRAPDGRWVFTGGGWGHGVGMCQYGAIGMGEAGKRADQILRHYYHGSSVDKVY